MFYVSTISGNLTPFDPAIPPAATVPVTKVAPVNATTPPLDTPVSITPTNNEEAVVYDRVAPPLPHHLIGTTNAANIGRAGASMAYRAQEVNSEKPSDPTDSEVKILTSPIQESELVEEGTHGSPHRANPADHNAYQRSSPQKERKQVTIALDIMSAPVFTLRESAPLNEAQEVFAHHKYRHIPVVSDNGRLVGIISDRNFIGISSLNLSASTSLKSIMVTNVITARPETPIREIAQVMINHHFGCLPILNDVGTLVGILTRSDILRTIVNHAPIELWS